MPLKIFNRNAGLNRYRAIIRDWLSSSARDEMLMAKEYYEGNHDILYRQRMVMNESGGLSPVENLPNNRLVDNQYRKLVDQKTHYSLGKPITISSADDAYLEELNKIFDKRMFRQLRLLGKESISGGIAWLYPYYNEAGEFKVKVFPAYEICPIWTDSSHSELSEAIRLYSDTVLVGSDLKEVTIAEVFSTNGIDRYVYSESSIKPHDSEPHVDYMEVGGQPYNWTKVPLIPFKYNTSEIPLIRDVKCLQDALNQVLSDFQNNMEEDPRTTILVLKNYDGTNIPEFRRNLATYGVVKVHTVDGVQGGVETLKVEVNAQNYQAILMQLKRAIMENGRGFDAKEERMDGDPNQMNIESMYTDIDLDVNGMESEFQASFEELKWFIDQHLMHIGKPDYTDTPVEFVFNRDIFINEDAKIENCVKSVGILSNKTIVAHHPWVNDLQHELSQIEEDKAAELDEMEATMKVQAAVQPTEKGGGSE